MATRASSWPNSGGAKHFSQGSSSTQGSNSRPYNDKPGFNSSGFKQQWSTYSGSKPHVIPECQINNTGATHHMTPYLSVLETATPYDQDDKIIVGNGEGQGNKGSSSQGKE
ncbi:unnamed protein product [Prunus armeniaca]